MTSARETVELLLQTARFREAEPGEHGLRGSEWMALRFLSRANEFSRSPSALASFSGTTRATASQVVKTLETKGYLTRGRSTKDRRSVVLHVTPKGEKALLHDPFEQLVKAVAALDASTRGIVRNALRDLLTTLTGSRGYQHIDVCRDCVFLTRVNADLEATAEGSEFACRFFRATINPRDIDQLCVSFQRAAMKFEKPARSDAVISGTTQPDGFE